MTKHTKLGIVGPPIDESAVTVAGAVLGVSLVYLLDEKTNPATLSSDAPLVRIDGEDEAGTLSTLEALDLAGIWVPGGRWPRWAFTAAQRFGWPHMTATVPGGANLVPGAETFSAEDLSDLIDHGGDRVSLPAWVRTNGADGGVSCMRVDHPNDFSLALNKLRNRNPSGVLQIQPALEGPVYRLLAFKAGPDLLSVGVLEEFVTPSVYRVPLGMAMPVSEHDPLREEILARAGEVNAHLGDAWGYVEMEFVLSDGAVMLTDVQAPARLGEDIRMAVGRSLGVDLLKASLECALARPPALTPTGERGVAFTWLLTRSGVVTGFKGEEMARSMPGVVDVDLKAREGDILSHVVDLSSRERGGLIVAEGATSEIAKARLEAARAQVWINTSPTLP